MSTAHCISLILISYETAMKNPTMKNIFYVEDMYYYKNNAGNNVQVVPDYVKDRIEERDGVYYYVYTANGIEQEIKVNKTTGSLVYRHDQRYLKVDLNGDGVIQSGEREYYYVKTNFELSARNLQIISEQYADGKGENKNLLDYTIVDTKLNDSGVSESETISATDNFRKLHMQMLTISLEGDVNKTEFERNMGMTVDAFLASGVAPDATISMVVEDEAKVLNSSKKRDESGKLVPVHTENIEQYYVFRFYSYTEWKSLVTIEMMEKDDNGNWVSSNSTPQGRFYVNSSILDKMESDIEKILDGELIDYTTKY